VQRIFGLLPDDTGFLLLALWEEFEKNETAEARFAHAIDRAMPPLLNLANDGGSWRENGIRYERVVARIAPEIEAGCPTLWNYLDDQLRKARGTGWFGMEANTQEPAPPPSTFYVTFCAQRILIQQQPAFDAPKDMCTPGQIP
jgi:hypothetical protein